MVRLTCERWVGCIWEHIIILVLPGPDVVVIGFCQVYGCVCTHVYMQIP